MFYVGVGWWSLVGLWVIVVWVCGDGWSLAELWCLHWFAAVRLWLYSGLVLVGC